MGTRTTRKGSPLLGLQTLIDRVARTKRAEVSVRQALDAVKLLEVDPKTRAAKYRDAAVIGGTMSPVVRGIGRAVESGVMARGNIGARLAAVGKGLMRTNRGEVARHITEGALGGGGVRALQEQREIARAKDTAMRFLGQQRKKQAAELKKTVGKLADRVLRQGQNLPPIVSPDFDYEV